MRSQKIPSLQNIRSFLSKINFTSTYARTYSEYQAVRFYNSLRFLHPYLKNKKVLELGSRPYVFSLLLKKFYSDNNYFFTGFAKPRKKKHNFRFRNGTNEILLAINTKWFDMEKNSFPYQSKFFDLVLVMETLEHLREDPMFMIKEANRVLKKRGLLFLTTPNSVSWMHLFQLFQMQSPSESPTYTVGGRGNYKEYTPFEVKQLLESGGFKIRKLTTRDNNSTDSPESCVLYILKERMNAIIKKWGRNVGARNLYIYAFAQKMGPLKDRYPEGIYIPLKSKKNQKILL